MWLALALIGHIAKALGFLGDKLFIEKLLPSPPVLAFLSGIGGIFYFFLMPWFLELAPGKILFASIAAGALSIPSLIFFYRAVDRDEISRVVPAIGSIVPIATFILSFFILGERLSTQTLFALFFLIIGGFLVAFHSFASHFRRGIFPVFFLEVWVGFLFALSAVLLKYAFEGTNDISAFLWSRIGSVGAALFLLSNLEVQNRMRIARFHEKEARRELLYVSTKILIGIAPLFLWFAISYGSVTLVSALQGIQYPFLLILAIFFSRRFPKIFQEEIRPGVIVQKSFATIFILVGLALLL